MVTMSVEAALGVGFLIGYAIASSRAKTKIIEKIVKEPAEVTLEDVKEFISQSTDETVNEIIRHIEVERPVLIEKLREIKIEDIGVIDVTYMSGADSDYWGIFGYSTEGDTEYTRNVFSIDGYMIYAYIESQCQLEVTVGDYSRTYGAGLHWDHILAPRGWNAVTVRVTGKSDEGLNYIEVMPAVADGSRLLLDLPPPTDVEVHSLPDFVTLKQHALLGICIETYAPLHVRIHKSWTIINSSDIYALLCAPLNEEVEVSIGAPYAGIYRLGGTVLTPTTNDGTALLMIPIPKNLWYYNLYYPVFTPCALEPEFRYIALKTNIPEGVLPSAPVRPISAEIVYVI